MRINIGILAFCGLFASSALLSCDSADGGSDSQQADSSGSDCQAGTALCVCLGGTVCNADLECREGYCVEPADSSDSNADAGTDGTGGCDPNHGMCLEDGNLEVCNPKSKQLEVLSCDELCMEIGSTASDKCDTEPQSGNDLCFCGEQCIPDWIGCLDQTDLGLCDENGKFVGISCAAVCMQLGGFPKSEGCNAASGQCLCAGDCIPDWTLCHESSNELDFCNKTTGETETSTCDAVCAKEGKTSMGCLLVDDALPVECNCVGGDDDTGTDTGSDTGSDTGMATGYDESGATTDSGDEAVTTRATFMRELSHRRRVESAPGDHAGREVATRRVTARRLVNPR